MDAVVADPTAETITPMVTALDRLLGPDHPFAPNEVRGLRAIWTRALSAYGLADEGGDPSELVHSYATRMRQDLGEVDAADLQTLDQAFSERDGGNWADPWFCRALYLHPALEGRAQDCALFCVGSVCGLANNFFIVVDMGKRLIAAGLPEFGLDWMERGVGLIHRDFHADPQNQAGILGALTIYFQWMAETAFAAGQTDRAIRTELLRHACDPTGCDFVALSRYLDAHPATPSYNAHQILVGRVPLAPILARFGGVFLTVRPEGAADGVETRHLFSEAGTAHGDTQVFGDTIRLGAGTTPASEGAITRLRNVEFHVDYWKTLVVDREGHMLRQYSSGPAEFALLAERLGYRARPALLPGITALVSETHVWTLYYHWLIEILPRLGMLLQAHEPFDRVVAHKSRHRFCQEGFEALGISDTMVLDSEHEVRGAAESLVIPSSNLHLTHFGHGFVRSLFLGPGAPPRPRGRRLFISRRAATQRHVLNEDALIELLIPRGFEIVQMEGMSMRQQAAMMAEAEVVMGPHGAGLSNIVFCAREVRVIELMPPGGPLFFHQIAACLGLDYTVIETAWDGSRTHMTADIALCRSALDRLGL